MPDRVVMVQQTPEEAEAWRRRWGGYNDFPPGWREVAETDFTRDPSVDHFHPFQEARQMRVPGTAMLTARLFFHVSGTSGHAVARDWQAGRMRYFRFGCAHRRVTHENPAMCQHVYHCQDCGWRWEVDSSD